MVENIIIGLIHLIILYQKRRKKEIKYSIYKKNNIKKNKIKDTSQKQSPQINNNNKKEIFIRNLPYIFRRPTSHKIKRQEKD